MDVSEYLIKKYVMLTVVHELSSILSPRVHQKAVNSVNKHRAPKRGRP